jgi:hypothetical protein
MTVASFVQHLTTVQKNQKLEIEKLKSWMEKSKNEEDFKNIIQLNNDTLSLMENNLSYITWKLEMMTIILEDGEEEDEDEMIESEFRVIEFY